MFLNDGNKELWTKNTFLSANITCGAGLSLRGTVHSLLPCSVLRQWFHGYIVTLNHKILIQIIFVATVQFFVWQIVSFNIVTSPHFTRFTLGRLLLPRPRTGVCLRVSFIHSSDACVCVCVCCPPSLMISMCRCFCLAFVSRSWTQLCSELDTATASDCWAQDLSDLLRTNLSVTMVVVPKRHSVFLWWWGKWLNGSQRRAHKQNPGIGQTCIFKVALQSHRATGLARFRVRD